ncbi:unnamed protein product [Protopolystoma xenopodis]|uniref:Uncharacterized protein n=1 Tax=Protopolystoma xenopodis TaxID=117903 RepID=A0A3S4ZKB9_9PLAT|nr:unnamed protein product [Protopolystoma xenopodis]
MNRGRREDLFTQTYNHSSNAFPPQLPLEPTYESLPLASLNEIKVDRHGSPPGTTVYECSVSCICLPEQVGNQLADEQPNLEAPIVERIAQMKTQWDNLIQSIHTSLSQLGEENRADFESHKDTIHLVRSQAVAALLTGP